MKLVHWLPALFVIFSLAMVVGAFFRKWMLIPLAVYILAVWVVGMICTRSVKIGSLGVVTSLIQLYGYGTGFIRSYVWKILLRHGRDEAQEREMRRGK